MNIGIDMDGVVANAIAKAVKNVNSKYRLNISTEEIDENGTEAKVYERLPVNFRTLLNGKSDIRPAIYTKSFFKYLSAYDGAHEGVKKIYELGHKIFFVTKIIDWENSPGEKYYWLRKNFKSIEWNLICVERMEDKALVDVDIIIDDDPRVMETFPRTKILMKRNWNKKYRERRCDDVCIEVSSMLEAAEQIRLLEG